MKGREEGGRREGKGKARQDKARQGKAVGIFWVTVDLYCNTIITIQIAKIYCAKDVDMLMVLVFLCCCFLPPFPSPFPFAHVTNLLLITFYENRYIILILWLYIPRNILLLSITLLLHPTGTIPNPPVQYINFFA